MMTKACGMIETLGLANSILVADVMLKTANVCLVGQKEVSQAYYTIVIEGEVSAVQLAIEKGVKVAQDASVLLAFDVIPGPVEDTKKLLT